MRGHYKSVKILIDGGADVNAVDKRELTTLMRAFAELGTSSSDIVNSVQYKIIRYLLDNGADPTVEDTHGQSVLNNPKFKHFIQQVPTLACQICTATTELSTRQCNTSFAGTDNTIDNERFQRKCSFLGLVFRPLRSSKEDTTRHPRESDATNRLALNKNNKSNTCEFTKLF